MTGPAKPSINAGSERTFGHDYLKINTVFKRDERNLIVPGDWALPEFEYLSGNLWRWTEKVDGTNIRVHWNGERITIGGRTDNAQVPTFLLAALEGLRDPSLFRHTFSDSTRVKPYAEDVTLYGEGYGPKIQSGGQYRDTPSLILFDVRVGDWWLRPADVARCSREARTGHRSCHGHLDTHQRGRARQ